VTLVLDETADGAIAIAVQATHDARPTCDTPAYRMAVYLLAASRHPPSWKADVPRVDSVDLLRECGGRVFRLPIR
jgi:hypothetical protein